MDGVLDDNMLLIRYIYKHCRFRQTQDTCIIPDDPAAVLRLMLSKITCHQGCVIKVMKGYVLGRVPVCTSTTIAVEAQTRCWRDV